MVTADIETLFAALGDRTRRTVFEKLRKGPRAVGEIAADLPVSRPAVSQHLKVLKDTGLVREYVSGRNVFYSINAQGLSSLRSYLDSFWDDALSAFAVHVEERGRPSRGRSGKK
jgi:DNA-binding transcriptional ArsR family regulator